LDQQLGALVSDLLSLSCSFTNGLIFSRILVVGVDLHPITVYAKYLETLWEAILLQPIVKLGAHRPQGFYTSSSSAADVIDGKDSGVGDGTRAYVPALGELTLATQFGRIAA
jgi:hypothetical protein